MEGYLQYNTVDELVETPLRIIEGFPNAMEVTPRFILAHEGIMVQDDGRYVLLSEPKEFGFVLLDPPDIEATLYYWGKDLESMLYRIHDYYSAYHIEIS